MTYISKTMQQILKDVQVFWSSEIYSAKASKSKGVMHQGAIIMWFALLAALILFMFLNIDHSAAIWARNLSHTTRRIGEILTDIGKSDWIIYLCAAYIFLSPVLQISRFQFMPHQKYWITHIRQRVWIILTTIAVSGLSVNLLKYCIGRGRPKTLDTEGSLSFHFFIFDSDYASFPSGHSTTATALAMTLALMIPKYRMFFIVLGVLIASTRVIVGAHYPSDVLAGIVYGGVSAMVIYYYMIRKKYITSPPKSFKFR